MSSDPTNPPQSSEHSPQTGATTTWLSVLPSVSLVQQGPTPERDIRDVLLVLIGVFLVPSVLAVVGLSLLEGIGVTESEMPVAYIASQYGINFTGFLLVGLGYLAWRGIPDIIGIRKPTLEDLGTIIAGFLALVLVMFAVESIVDLLGVRTAENEAIEQGTQHPELFLVLLPMQFLFTGPAEELIFRGVLQGLFRRTGGLVLGLFGSSLIFALFHLPALSGSATVPTLVTLGIIFVSGLFLAGLYEYTGTLVVPIIVHALWNSLLFGMQYSEVAQIAPIG